ncbi:hypothetical protein GGF32_000604 [Allomyces javanicus]|nr:hypothetical protein GGF32_000604 [Allomyces javanicus]
MATPIKPVIESFLVQVAAAATLGNVELLAESLDLARVADMEPLASALALMQLDKFSLDTFRSLPATHLAALTPGGRATITEFLVFLAQWGLRKPFPDLLLAYARFFRSFAEWFADEAPTSAWISPLVSVLFKQLIAIARQTKTPHPEIWDLVLKPIPFAQYPAPLQLRYFMFQGELYLGRGNHEQAEAYLTEALVLCPTWSARNRERILCHLILARLALGLWPPRDLLAAYALDTAWVPVLKAMRAYNVPAVEAAIDAAAPLFVRNGVYIFLWEQLRPLVVRNALALCVQLYCHMFPTPPGKIRTMSISFFSATLRLVYRDTDSTQDELDAEAYLKLTSLIAQGRVKGYVTSQINKETKEQKFLCVLPKGEPQNVVLPLRRAMTPPTAAVLAGSVASNAMMVE